MIMKRNIFQILSQLTRRISSQASNKYAGFDLNNYRSLLRVKGADAAPFLQNLITNDINNLSTVENQVIFSMILNGVYRKKNRKLCNTK